MKFNFSLLAILFSIIIIIPSCNKDKDEDNRDQFLGTYNVTELCDGYEDIYVMVFSEGTEDDEVNILNLYDDGLNITGKVDGDEIDFDQEFNQFGYTFSYNGKITKTNESTINIIFNRIEVGYGTDNCTATGIKL